MDIKDVEKLADLARIELTDLEKESMLRDMKGILEYVKVIEGVEVPARSAFSIADAGGEDITPDYTVHNAWREDEIMPRDFSYDLVVDQFPNKQDGFLKVKKIL